MIEWILIGKNWMELNQKLFNWNFCGWKKKIIGKTNWIYWVLYTESDWDCRNSVGMNLIYFRI